MSEEKNEKPIRSVFKVSRKKYITPHYIRVYFTGDAVGQVANTTVGVNNKILIPPKGVKDVHFPEYDPETGSWTNPGEDVKPIVRTYTHRGIDTENDEIWIDFVAHGDEGPASAWAINAEKDDVLGIMMKPGKKQLYPATDHYLLVGDATAIPVLSAILEDLPATAKAKVVIEVPSKEDEQNIISKAEVEYTWLHNPTPHKGSVLADVVKSMDLPETSRFAYVAAEFSSVKALRNYLRKEQKWEREELYAYSYWKAGVAEDRSVKHRREETKED